MARTLARDSSEEDDLAPDLDEGTLVDTAAPPDSHSRGHRSSPELDAQERRLEAGDTIGRNLVLSVLGSGAMGVVYEAFDPDLDRRLAIKLMRTAPAEGSQSTQASEGDRARMLAEARALAKIAHPNVITIYDVGIFDDQVFMAMELVDGQTLRDWVSAEQPTLETVLEHMLAAGQGLAAVHRSGLIHRDFKPDNVLVGRDGRVCIADFGLAGGSVYASPGGQQPSSGAQVELEGLSQLSVHEKSSVLASTQTQATIALGIRSGTPSYMAPEMHGGFACDALSDQFAYCVSLFELLVGHRPFKADSAAEFIEQVQAREFRGRKQTWAQLPAWLRTLIVRGLSAQPGQRHASFEELLVTIAQRLEAPQRRRRQLQQTSWVLALGGAGVLLAMPLLTDSTLSCRELGRLQPRSWDQAVRSEVASRFRKSELSYADHSWQQVARGLDAYARAWSDARESACEARRESLARGLGSTEDFDLAVTCLESAELSLAALTVQLAGGDDAVIAKSVEAVFSLPTLAHCSPGHGQLRSRVRPAKPGPEATNLVRLRAELAAVETLVSTGQLPLAQARAEALLERALGRVPDYPAFHAKVHALLAKIHLDTNRMPRVLEHARGSLRSAIAASDDVAAAQAATMLIFGEGYRLQRWDRVPDLLEGARALVAAAGHQPSLVAELARNQVTALPQSSDPAELLEHSRRAVEVLTELHGREHPEVATAMIHPSTSSSHPSARARGAYSRPLRWEVRHGSQYPLGGPHATILASEDPTGPGGTDAESYTRL